MDEISIYIIVVLFLIAIAILILPPLLYPDMPYGHYEVTSDRCIANGEYCSEGGTRTIVQECIPNPINNGPCILDGRETYESIVTTEPCSVQCFSSKWKLIETKCEDNDLVDVYECVNHDGRGANDCGMFERFGINNGYIRKYVIKPMGSFMTRINVLDGCLNEIPQGNWVFENSQVDRYVMSSECMTNDHLEEGYYSIPPVCIVNGKIQDEVYCGTKPPDYLQPCRKLSLISNHDIIQQLHNSFILIEMKGMYVSVAEQGVAKTELILSNFKVPFFIASRGLIHESINTIEFKALLACTPRLNQDGWITSQYESGVNKLYWNRSSKNPGGPGLSSNQATKFNLTIDLNNQTLTIAHTDIIDAKFTIHSMNELRSLYIT